MTKERIIDGINVAECAYYYSDNSVFRLDWCCFHHCSESWNGKCDSVPDCYYKQLQRKNLECEELKKAAFTLAEGLNFRQKMLDEIENFAKRHCNSCEDNGQQLCSSNYCYRHYLLDIIDKAKGDKE